ncbi:hypothetical protein SAMN02910400_01060 [Lachnospiraceae bacterium C10]|nr:hypothetical protein SAMN02910400_01060 [Lachnospiraceae bacterium C10]
MAISNEFKQAVMNKDILEIRLLLKNSLLLDTSFGKYREMLNYVNSSGVNIWIDSKPVDRKEKPWTKDLMNYELTAIVNDFSEDHMQYLQDIISYVYNGRIEQPRNYEINENARSINYDRASRDVLEYGKEMVSDIKQEVQNEVSAIELREKKKKIIKELSQLTKLLKNARIDKSVNISSVDNIAWDYQLYADLKNEAQEIIRICSYLQRRK